MGKLYLFNVYTFCKSLCVINEGSPPYGLHEDPIFILYLYDHMWLVGILYISVNLVGIFSLARLNNKSLNV